MKLAKFFMIIFCILPDWAIAQHLSGSVLDERTLKPLSWANLSYLTSGHSETDYVYENFKMNVYLSKKIAKDQFRLNLGVTDLFGTSRFKTSTRVDNLYKYVYNDMDPRGVYFSVTYDFNPAKNKYKGEKASREKQRLY